MSEFEGYPVIVADVGGRRRRLANERQWRAAISDRSIARDTMIELQEAPGLTVEKRAGECSVLIPLLDEFLGPAPDPEPEPTPEIEASDSTPVDEEQPVSSASRSSDPVEESSNVEEADESSAQHSVPDVEPQPPVQRTDDTAPAPAKREHSGSRREQDPKESNNTIIAVVAVLGICIALWALGSADSDESSEDTVEAGAADVEAAADAMTDDMMEPDLPLGTTYYTKATTDYTDQPGGQTIGEFARGTSFNAVPADGDSDWLLITRGPNSGRYVSAAAASTDSRPDLDTSTADDYFVIRPTSVYASPDSSSYRLREVPFPTKVKIAGSVAGGFAEALIDGLPVGYVDWSDLGGEGGHGQWRWLRIVNNCGRQVNAVFNIQKDGRYQGFNGFWRFPPYSSSPLVFNGSEKLYTDSVFNYWLDITDSVDGNSSVYAINGDNVSVDGKSMGMKRIVPRAVSDDEYVLNVCG